MSNNLFKKLTEDKIENLKVLINNEEEFNLIFGLIRNKVVKKFKWKFIYTEQDVVEVIDMYLTEEILKRKLLNI